MEQVLLLGLGMKIRGWDSSLRVYGLITSHLRRCDSN
jgi:hypothetical protein